jgi:hypothetical protein
MARASVVKVVAVAALLAGGVVAAALSFFPGRSHDPMSPEREAGIRGQGSGVGQNEASLTPDPSSLAPSSIHFKDVTAAAGIDFKHFDGITEMRYIMDIMGSGIGWIDYDRDGLMDLFIVQSSTFAPPHVKSPPTCKLYKNLGGGRFRDVTEEVGLQHTGCGMGVAVGDIDNDGYPDLFITYYGQPNVLYHNVSDGKGGRRFVDISAQAGVATHPDWSTRPNFSTSAAFLDYDNDGYLDLFVCSYVKVDVDHYPDCKDPLGVRDICHPGQFESTRCVLYHNNRNGTFTDVSKGSGIAYPEKDPNGKPTAKALGVVALDLFGDGRTDLFVANDGVPNFLFRNLGNGRFEPAGPSCGCLVNLNGEPQAYMGVDADDLTGHGLPDILSTAFSHQGVTLFRNEGEGQFLDVTFGSGLGPATWLMLGFGACFLDADNDGKLDIFIANGHVSRRIDLQGDKKVTFRQRAQLFRNQGQGHFEEITSQAGPYFQQPHVGRGAAPCDYDNDGRMDLAVSNNAEAAYLLHNESTTAHHWLRLELVGGKSNRDAVGAKVTFHLDDGRKLVRHRKGGGSYLSAGDPRLLVGLGSATRVAQVEIRWPSGLEQRAGPLAADHGYRVTEGQDKVIPRP